MSRNNVVSNILLISHSSFTIFTLGILNNLILSINIKILFFSSSARSAPSYTAA